MSQYLGYSSTNDPADEFQQFCELCVFIQDAGRNCRFRCNVMAKTARLAQCRALDLCCCPASLDISSGIRAMFFLSLQPPLCSRVLVLCDPTELRRRLVWSRK